MQWLPFCRQRKAYRCISGSDIDVTPFNSQLRGGDRLTVHCIDIKIHGDVQSRISIQVTYQWAKSRIAFPVHERKKAWAFNSIPENLSTNEDPLKDWEVIRKNIWRMYFYSIHGGWLHSKLCCHLKQLFKYSLPSNVDARTSVPGRSRRVASRRLGKSGQLVSSCSNTIWRNLGTGAQHVWPITTALCFN